MTLRRRLGKLEARRRTEAGPRVIALALAWQGEGGSLETIAEVAQVLTPGGWRWLTRAAHEAEAVFMERAEAMADGGSG
jgi:hypothetical protein